MPITIYMEKIIHISQKPFLSLSSLYLHYRCTMCSMMPDRCACLKVESGFFKMKRGYMSRNSSWGTRHPEGCCSNRAHLEGSESQGQCRRRGEEGRKDKCKAILIRLVIGRLEKQRQFSSVFSSQTHRGSQT